MPHWLAPLARTLFSVWPPWPPTCQPIVPPTASGPMIVRLPVLETSHTGWFLLAAVTFAVVHCVIVSDFDPPRLTFSVVSLNRPITSPLTAASYAACTVL